MINCVMMKEIFDICRFKALAWKYYRENMKTILIFLGVMVVVTFMVVCKFNPFRMEYTSLYTESNYLDRYYGMFAKIFWGLLGFFLLRVIRLRILCPGKNHSGHCCCPLLHLKSCCWPY